MGLWYSSHNNSVYHNTFSDNNEDGLIVYESSFNDITLNTIQHNNLSGINVYGSCCNTIAGNTIENNLDFGVKISSTFSQQAKNNCFHHNNFIQNIPSNAYVREHNMWDLGGLGGNYWDDYIGVDSDSDGFGDEPYVLGGGNEDFYPYMHKIIVSFPEKPGTPIGPSSASIHKNVSFHFYCTHPGEYQLYYLVDWGDDSIDEWFGPFPSDEAVELSHSWEKKGEYGVKVKTRNVLGAESEWSDLLPVSMPKNSNSLEKSLSNEDQENNGIILMLAFPTEFYEYETNYTFMCPGGGYGLWISCDGIHYNTFCGAVLEKDNFIGIANPIIILGIKIR